jgi:hypothetical protein
MHPLHDYVAKQLASHLTARGVVVWFDPRREFAPFIDELRGGPRARGALTAVTVGPIAAQLAEFDGSMFELRALAEPLVGGDVPGKLVVYLPGIDSEPTTSVLLELELAGERYQPGLKRLARNVLAQRYTDGVIDELTNRPNIGWAELAQAASDTSGAEAPSTLKTIFRKAKNGDELVAAWLATDQHDGAIADKDGAGELVKLVRSRLGLELPDDATLAKLRAITLRYVLGSEFRSDLRGAAPASLDSIPVPKNGKLDAVRDCAHRLRSEYADAYADLADRVEAELGLASARFVAADLGAIDTFRFEERALLAWCDELIARGQYAEALAVADERSHSHWLERDITRKAMWEACRRMAELGQLATSVRAAVTAMPDSATAWIEAYTAPDGWHRVDQAQRRLESWLAHLPEDCAEAPLGVVRAAYDETCRLMADGFTRALAMAQWNVPGVLHQTRVYSDTVTAQPRPVAYFLVDAMRYEMGVELVARLPRNVEVALRPAVTALPSITPVGMSALLPGAAASYSVVAQRGKLGGRIDDAFLPDLAARKRHAAARVPDLVDLTLDEVLTWKQSRVTDRVAGKQVVIVRSQEIDHAGEAGFMATARRTMDTVIDNLARAVRRLAAAGVEHAVISADHGHLFFADDRDPSLRIDAPGGDTVELHRRCWIGRGGATPPGCVRVAATALGYDSDLELVFPAGAGVFRAGGDLAFHHGGPSLQELVVPVITVRTKPAAGTARGTASPVTIAKHPTVITAQALSAQLQLGGPNLALFTSALTVRPMLMAGDRQVGQVGAALEAQVVGGCVTLEPGKTLTVMFLLADPTVASVRIVVQDPATDAELCQSAEIPVRLGV